MYVWIAFIYLASYLASCIYLKNILCAYAIYPPSSLGWLASFPLRSFVPVQLNESQIYCSKAKLLVISWSFLYYNLVLPVKSIELLLYLQYYVHTSKPSSWFSFASWNPIQALMGLTAQSKISYDSVSLNARIAGLRMTSIASVAGGHLMRAQHFRLWSYFDLSRT